MPKSKTLLDHLEALFRAVVRAVTAGSAAEWGELGRNPKGDQRLTFSRFICQALGGDGIIELRYRLYKLTIWEICHE